MFSFSVIIIFCGTSAGSYPVAGLPQDSHTRNACGTVQEWDWFSGCRTPTGLPHRHGLRDGVGEGPIFSPAQGSNLQRPLARLPTLRCWRGQASPASSLPCVRHKSTGHVMSLEWLTQESPNNFSMVNYIMAEGKSGDIARSNVTFTI